ncbi:MAG TPA: LytR C-terminal domain-containing protein [Mycobacteriales bacterium]|nr:LytR C-terminal domain-containing protein [Mycobacteriales bacterium]
MSRVRSWLAAPLGTRLLGAACAAAGVALLVVGLVALNGGGGGTPGAAPPPATATTAPSATGEPSGQPSTPTPSPATTMPPATTPPSSSVAPTTPAPPPPRAPLTVLNNSTISGLGDQAAIAARRHGWPVAAVGNFAGRLPQTTVYYTPGDPTEERAARQFATEFPQVQRVFPRYAGLPPTPAGIVLVVTRDWVD